MTISEKIFKKLLEINMSQSEFSRKTGISTSTVNDWKQKKTNPSADKLLGICKALEISLEDLLCDDGEKEAYRADYVIDENYVIEVVGHMDTEAKKRVLSYLEKAISKEEPV